MSSPWAGLYIESYIVMVSSSLAMYLVSQRSSEAMGHSSHFMLIGLLICLQI